MDSVKFLVIRFSSIGDIVLTTPVVRCLKTQVEGAEVHFLTKPGFASILESNPYLDKVITLNDDIRTTIQTLKDEQYDHIIDLHNNLRTMRVKRALGIPAFAFNKLNVEKWMMVNLKVNRLPEAHIVDRYMETLRHFNVENDGKGLDFEIDPAAFEAVRNLPAPYNQGYYALVIGAKHATKRMTTLGIGSLIRQIGLPVVLLGGKEDMEVAKEVTAHTAGLTLDAVGKYSLAESAALLDAAKFVITHDTGLMHIAAARKKKIISVWGNTIPAFGMTPYGAAASEIFEVKGLNCRPCSKIGYHKCPKSHFKCMNDQDLVGMAALARQWWG